MNSSPVHIGAVGMACPLGQTWTGACAAIRAGISRRTASPYRDDQGREIAASYVQELQLGDAPPDERWLALLAQAMSGASCRDGAARLDRMPLFLTLPEMRDGRACPAAYAADALSARLGLRIPTEHVHVLAGGAHGGLAALREARALARAGRPCIVAAADSLLSARRLRALSVASRLLVDDNSDGVTPGEAAAALILGQEARGGGARLLGLGFTVEPSRLDNDVPLRAEGLIGATRMALAEASLDLHELDFRVSDAAGESFHFKEQALLVARLLRERKREFPLWLPATCLGDTGAAAGTCGILVAIAAWARGYAPGPRALVCAGDEHGTRAAVVLERAT